MISCIIPTTWKEVTYLERCLNSLIISANLCSHEVEIIVVDNGVRNSTPNIVEKFNDPRIKYLYLEEADMDIAKNYGAKNSRGEILCFLDADNYITEEFFPEISRKMMKSFYVGGGMKHFKFTRFSTGIFFYFFITSLVFLLTGIIKFYDPITVGAFWIRREVFNAIGGWRTFRIPDFKTKLFFYMSSLYYWADDVDFGLRLKKYAKDNNKKSESLKKTILIWNTRNMDKYGDWSWLKWKYLKIW